MLQSIHSFQSAKKMITFQYFVFTEDKEKNT